METDVKKLLKKKQKLIDELEKLRKLRERRIKQLGQVSREIESLKGTENPFENRVNFLKPIQELQVSL